jgi:hypothetical protein
METNNGGEHHGIRVFLYTIVGLVGVAFILFGIINLIGFIADLFDPTVEMYFRVTVFLLAATSLSIGTVLFIIGRKHSKTK